MIDKEDIDQHVRLRILEGARQKRQYIIADMYKRKEWNEARSICLDNIPEIEVNDYPLSEMIMKEFMDSLTKTQRKILKLRLLGYNQSEIARIYKQNKSNICHLIKSIRSAYLKYENT